MFKENFSKSWWKYIFARLKCKTISNKLCMAITRNVLSVMRKSHLSSSRDLITVLLEILKETIKRQWHLKLKLVNIVLNYCHFLYGAEI